MTSMYYKKKAFAEPDDCTHFIQKAETAHEELELIADGWKLCTVKFLTTGEEDVDFNLGDVDA